MSRPSSVRRTAARRRSRGLTVAPGSYAEPPDDVGCGSRQRFGQPRRQHAGVDRAGDRRPSPGPGRAPADRAPHRSPWRRGTARARRAARRRRCARAAARARLDAARGSSRAARRPRRRRPRPPRARGRLARVPQSTSTGDEPCVSATASAAPLSGAGSVVGTRGPRPRGRSATPGATSIEQAVERLGGRLGAGVEPVGEADVGIGAETEHGGQIAGEIGDAHPGGVAGVARLTGEHQRARGGEHGRTGSAGGGPEGDEQRRRPSSRGARAPAAGGSARGRWATYDAPFRPSRANFAIARRLVGSRGRRVVAASRSPLHRRPHRTRGRAPRLGAVLASPLLVPDRDRRAALVAAGRAGAHAASRTASTSTPITSAWVTSRSTSSSCSCSSCSSPSCSPPRRRRSSPATCTGPSCRQAAGVPRAPCRGISLVGDDRLRDRRGHRAPLLRGPRVRRRDVGRRDRPGRGRRGHPRH